jgi:hypothetical protein
MTRVASITPKLLVFRGKILMTMFQLRKNLQFFFTETKTPLAKSFPQVPWLQQAPYLVDIFSKLNEGLLSMQGHNITVLTAADTVDAVNFKLVSWQQCV